MASSTPSPLRKQVVALSHQKSIPSDKIAACLPALPEELLSNIATRLGCDDLCAFRLTCKDVDAKSFHDFAMEHFSDKCFMITTESLKVLVGIANDQRLRPYLHNVHIVTALFSENVLKCPHGCACAPTPTVRAWEAHITYVRDQKRLIKDGDAKRMLTEAFQKLPSMKKLSLVDSWDLIEQTIDCRGRNKAWRTTHIKPSLAPPAPGGPIDYAGARAEYSDWKTTVWKLMLRALAESCSTSLETFAGLFQTPSNGIAIKADMPRSKTTQKGLQRALRNVKRLCLSIQAGPQSLITRDKVADVAANTRVVKSFAALFPAVEDLLLDYESKPPSGPIHNTLVTTVDQNRLSHLQLDNLQIKADLLATTFAKMPVIKILKATFVNLTEGSWVVILHTLQKLQTLEHLHLMYLLEGGRKAFFLEQPEDPDEWEDELGMTAEMINNALGTDSDDDDLPDLEPAGTPDVAAGGEDDARKDDSFDEVDFKAPGHEHVLERGYYVCLSGAKTIAKYLPVFIKEYNVGMDMAQYAENPFPFPLPQQGAGGPAAAGPTSYATLMNTLAMLGGPPGISLGGTNPHNAGQTGPGSATQSQSQGQGQGQGSGPGPGPAPLSVGPFHIPVGPGFSFGLASTLGQTPVTDANGQQSSTMATNSANPAPGSLADLVANSPTATGHAAAPSNLTGTAVPVSTTATVELHDDGADGTRMQGDDGNDLDDVDDEQEGQEEVAGSEGGIGLDESEDSGMQGDDEDEYDGEVLARVHGKGFTGGY